MSVDMFNPKIEYKSLEEIKSFQEKKMREALHYLRKNSRFYQNLFMAHHIDVNNIHTLEDLSCIPFTEKHHLQEFNQDFICVASQQIVDYITTSGTLSDPVTFAMSDRDLERLAYNEAISFTCADGNKDDIYQLMTTIDKRFMAGLAYFLGIRRMGAGIIRVGNGIPQLQWDTIQRIKPNAIICVPSFILRIVEYAEQNGIDYRNSSIKKAICIGENLRDQDFNLNLLGQKIKEKWNIELYSTYASTEMATTFTECKMGQGGHHHPELIICELVDEMGNPVPDGAYGELVITTLGVEAMPLLRFKTGDIARFYSEPCACGRNTKRISPILCRAHQMIKFKGTTLYPAAIFDVLDTINNVSNYYVELVDSNCGTDDVIVHLGSNTLQFDDLKMIKDKFRARLRVAPNLVIHKPEEIEKIHALDMNRKPRKLIDKRNNITLKSR